MGVDAKGRRQRTLPRLALGEGEDRVGGVELGEHARIGREVQTGQRVARVVQDGVYDRGVVEVNGRARLEGEAAQVGLGELGTALREGQTEEECGEEHAARHNTSGLNEPRAPLPGPLTQAPTSAVARDRAHRRCP